MGGGGRGGLNVFTVYYTMQLISCHTIISMYFTNLIKKHSTKIIFDYLCPFFQNIKACFLLFLV